MHPRARDEGHPPPRGGGRTAAGTASGRERCRRRCQLGRSGTWWGRSGGQLGDDPSVDGPRVAASAALTDTARGLVLEAFHSLNALAMQAGSAGQLSAALVWGLTGLAVALAVSVATETIVSD